MYFHTFNFFFFVDKFDLKTFERLTKNTTLIYRNYSIKYNKDEIIKIKNYCRRRNLKFYLSNEIKLAIKLNLDGTYIPSFNKSFNHMGYNLKKKFKLLGSAHNLKQIRQKEMQNVQNIFISPIFLTKNYKVPLGLYRFLNLKKIIKIETTCLGGINYKNLKLLKMAKLKNVAGISLFIKN